MTLAEVLIASIIGLMVFIGFTTMDISQVRMQAQVRTDATLNVDQGPAALAAIRLARALERADRLCIRSNNRGNVQIRTFKLLPADRVNCAAVGPGCPVVCNGCTVAGAPPPPPSACCFDIPGNYQWDQFRRISSTDELRLYSNTGAGCGNMTVLARNITDMSVNFRNEAGAPPGGEPFGGNIRDNNTVEYSIRWDNGPKAHIFNGQVTSRAIPYSNVNANPGYFDGDSGSGLTTASQVNYPIPATCGPPPQ